MKIRFGFISNSSSTTFICPACNNHFDGWDWDDDPLCDECGCHIYHYKGTLANYLIEKYNLNREKEIKEYLETQYQSNDPEPELEEEELDERIINCFKRN